MTETEFVVWLSGFVNACNEYAPTPKQWDDIKDKLNTITRTAYSVNTDHESISKTW
jgi:truncated hemoglobin YjbI